MIEIHGSRVTDAGRSVQASHHRQAAQVLNAAQFFFLIVIQFDLGGVEQLHVLRNWSGEDQPVGFVSVLFIRIMGLRRHGPAGLGEFHFDYPLG